MKLKLLFCAGICLTACCLSACGDQPDSSEPAAGQSDTVQTETEQTETTKKDKTDDSENIMITLHNGQEVPISDASSTVRETEEGYLWEFHGGECTITLPKSWESRFIIRDTTVYCLACFERAEFVSSLFRIEFRSAEEAAAEPVPVLILGSAGKEYICAVLPDIGEPENGVLRREYTAMTAEREAVLQTATCSSNEQNALLATETYMPASENVTSALYGDWKLSKTRNGKLNETLTFRTDGTLTFTSDGEVQEGSYLLNIYASTYDWTNQSNWGDAAMVFLDGKVYLATYYEGTRRTLKFTPVLLPPDSSDTLSGSVYEQTAAPE